MITFDTEHGIEERLKADPHVRIIPGEEWDFPEIDYSVFKEEEQGRARKAVSHLQEYLSMRYVIEEFDTHADRRRWRNTFCMSIAGQYDTPEEAMAARDCANLHFNKNALKRNAIGFLFTSIFLIKKAYVPESEHDKEEFERLVGEVEQVQKRMPSYGKALLEVKDVYDPLPAYDPDKPDKVDFVNDLKQKAFAVLEYLAVRD